MLDRLAGTSGALEECATPAAEVNGDWGLTELRLQAPTGMTEKARIGPSEFDAPGEIRGRL
jgi:hypothetical protein